MSKISTVQARDQLSTVVNRAAFAKERVVLTRRGRELAAIVPLEDLALLEQLEERMDLEAARAALGDVKRQGSVSWKRLKADLGL
ncbi:MAG: type II toxin-antitoxin system Phd/YefM family antitoxin [Gemmatimonadota bacterium]